jgi:predicted phosphoadenosine phosphosulfate sulfurtransferase
VSDLIPRTKQRKRQIANGRVQLDADVWTLACERTAKIFDSFDHVLVAFSGGKDSTATLQVALEVAHSDPRFERHLPLRVMHQDEEAIPFETEEYVRRIAQRDDVDLEWYCLPIRHRNACSRTTPWWWPWAPEAEDRWCRPLPPEALTTLEGFPIQPPSARLTAPDMMGLFAPPSRGNTAFLMGIRAQESLTRTRAVMSTGVGGVNYINKFDDGTSRGNVWKAYPIYDWTTEDMWTAPSRFGWDYNCNVYEAPIWMADYSFKPIGEVAPGDEIIGWEASVGRRAPKGQARQRLVRATVLAQHKRHSKIVKVTMESGRVIRCTPDHLWMHHRCGHPDSSNPFAPVKVGHSLSHVVEVPDVDDATAASRVAGWLAGVYDGEGCGDRIYQNPEHNPGVYAAIEDALNKLDIPYVRLNGNSNAQHGFRITGGRAALVRFLNRVQPIRRVSKQIDQQILGGRFRAADKIMSIEDDGEADVYALTTTTGNYVCWGYASKNSAYDRMEMAGVSRPQQRCSPAFGEEPLQKLHTYAACFPEVWDRMVDRVPGVGAAARYALTELYSYRDRPAKPPGMPWPEFITHYLRKHSPREAEMITVKLHKEVSLHYRKTSHPIVVDAPHPHTGVSWNWMLSIAMRGDFKDRKLPTFRVHADEQGRAKAETWHRYAKELARILADGAFADLAHPGRTPRDAWALVPAYARESLQERP